MTVRRLITALKKMPQDSKVAFTDFDQSKWETNNIIDRVEVWDYSEAPKTKDQCIEDAPGADWNQIKDMKGKWVILS